MSSERFGGELDVEGRTSDLSPSQAAQLTSLSRTLIYREIDRGHLSAYKVGGRLRITRDALAEWKRIHAVEPLPQPPYEPRRAVTHLETGQGGFGAELEAIRRGRAA